MMRSITAYMLRSRASGRKILLNTNSITCKYEHIDNVLEIRISENFVIIMILLKGLLWQGRADHIDSLLPGKVTGNSPRCSIIIKKLNPGN